MKAMDIKIRPFIFHTLITILSLIPIIGIIAPRVLGYIIPIVGVIGLIIYFIAYKAPPRFNWKPFAVVLAIIGLAGLSSLWSVDSEFSLERTFKIALILIPSCIAIGLVNQTQIEKNSIWIWVLASGLLVTALLILNEYISDFPLYRLSRGIEDDAIVALQHMNRSVTILVLAFFPIAFLINQTDEKNYKLLAIGILFIAILAVLSFTRSQSAQLAFLAGIIAFFLFPARLKFSWIVLGACISGLILAAPWIAQILYNSLNLIDPGNALIHEASIPHRLEIWDFVARRALENPLYGFGIESTRFMIFDGGQDYIKSNTILHPHNAALQLWVEFGVLGAILGSSFTLYCLWKIQSMDRQSARIALASFIACLSLASTGYGLWQSWQLGLFAYIIVLIQLNIRLREKIE